MIRTGTRVHRYDDPRHVGTVVAVFATTARRSNIGTAIVRWDTGPRSEEDLGDLVVTE